MLVGYVSCIILQNEAGAKEREACSVESRVVVMSLRSWVVVMSRMSWRPRRGTTDAREIMCIVASALSSNPLPFISSLPSPFFHSLPLSRLFPPPSTPSLLTTSPFILVWHLDCSPSKPCPSSLPFPPYTASNPLLPPSLILSFPFSFSLPPPSLLTSSPV